MEYSVEKSIKILERTPGILKVLLSGLDDEWIMSNDGPETFSPFDAVSHLIHGEKTDWVVRTKTILEFGINKPFEPYGRFAQKEESKGKTLSQLLDKFEALRLENLQWL
jgi:hypothetical protein